LRVVEPRIRAALELEDRGDLAGAFDAFTALINDIPQCGLAWRHLGNLYRLSGNLGHAGECFQRAIATGDDYLLNSFFLSAIGVGPVVDAPPRQFVSRLFDQYARTFDAHLISELHYTGPAVLRDLVARHNGGRRGRALDVGCGTGLVGEAVLPLVETIDGVDLSARMLDVAAARGIYSTLTHAALDDFLQRATRPYDLILACDVFIYLGDLRLTFQGIRRALKNEGLFAFTVEQCDAANGFELLPNLRYAHSAEYITRLATECAFEILEVADAPIRQQDGTPVHAAVLLLRAISSRSQGICGAVRRSQTS